MTTAELESLQRDLIRTAVWLKLRGHDSLYGRLMAHVAALNSIETTDS